MVNQCPSKKKTYNSKEVAEDILIELWTTHDYPENRAPLNVYLCTDCGYFHLTSRGPMNDKLAKYLAGGKIKLNKEASRWIDKFRNKF
jgi:hypothetical protein